ncbi:MAG: lysine biosynthesis protein LysX [Candidatus Korarchaeum sp.]|nr:lysine biosynthesis protein LysX [Candidatus Korarchaeum sp.]MDW8036333.1 lysine biosynthesis protein LysX [Candidatus Korarchaeum sp.]
MRVSLVYERIREEEAQLMRAVERSGHELSLVHLDSDNHFFLGEKVLESDVALIRAISQTKSLLSSELIANMGLRCVNSPETLRVCSNKLTTSMKLLESGIPTPRTAVAFSPEGAIRAAKSIGFPVVVKPINGSWGRLVSLARDEEELRAIVEHREAINSPYYRVHYIQEYVRKPGRDIRAYGTEERFVTAIYRISDHWITNTARGGRAEPIKRNEELEDIVLRTCEALGGGFLGVDVVEDEERGLLVIEANATTEFKNAARVTGVDIASEIVSYALGS